MGIVVLYADEDLGPKERLKRQREEEAKGNKVTWALTREEYKRLSTIIR